MNAGVAVQCGSVEWTHRPLLRFKVCSWILDSALTDFQSWAVITPYYTACVVCLRHREKVGI